MKFRGKLVNSSLLFRMAQSVEKLNRKCIFKLTQDEAHFIVANLSGDSNVQVWAKIEMNTIFEDIRIQSANNNEIWLEVSTDTLCRALKSTVSAIEASTKLTKKEDLPTLCFTIDQAVKSGPSTRVIQDVAVRVLTPPEAQEFREPMVPEPQVHIMMPSLAGLRTVVERLKALDTHVTVAGNRSGQLQLVVQNDNLHLDTLYNKLVNPQLDPSQVTQQTAERDPQLFAKVTVDARDLAKFVGSHIVNPSMVVCCIIENHALVFYVYVGSGNTGEESQNFGALTYYLPAKS